MNQPESKLGINNMELILGILLIYCGITYSLNGFAAILVTLIASTAYDEKEKTTIKRAARKFLKSFPTSPVTFWLVLYSEMQD